MISTRNLLELPSTEELIRLTKALATLDAIIEREWSGRYYSFNSRWDVNEQMASMRNGAGDGWFCVFGSRGAFLKGFDHESRMARPTDQTLAVWPGVLNELPKEFEQFAKEPAFAMEDTTFCIWRQPTDSLWRRGTINFPEGEDPDGSARLLSILDGVPGSYRNWAELYYNRTVSLAIVEQIYAHKPLTETMAKVLNPSPSLADLSEDLAEIGYPITKN